MFVFFCFVGGGGGGGGVVDEIYFTLNLNCCMVDAINSVFLPNSQT